jgi:spermidine synthase
MKAGATATAALPTPVAGAIVFFAGGSVLVLEVVGLRLVAPYVGVSLQSSTAVIGTALAAIALGAWTGGRLADDVGPHRLLAPTFVLAGAVTSLTLPLVRTVGPMARGDDPVSITTLAFLAVFAPCVFMASITPMVVKLQLRDLNLTGTIVGRLSGVGTLGGIVATFVTGFVLLVALPSGAIVVGLGVLTLLLGLALGFTRRRWRRPAGVLLVGLLTTTVPVVTPSPCVVETAYHCARVLDDPARSTGRLLVLDNLLHSYVDLEDPTYLEFPYVQAIASVADVMRPAGQAISALHLGAGGLTIPRYLATTRPGSVSRVLEIDAGVLALDQAQLRPRPASGSPPNSEISWAGVPGLDVHVGDARVALARERTGTRDLVVGDAFGGLAVPWHLTTREVAAQIARVLRPDGVYVVNVIDYPPNRFVRAEVATIAAVFPQLAILAGADELAGRAGGNFVVVASAAPLPLAALDGRLAQRATPVTVADDEAGRSFASGSPALTDDHAPVDQLITHPGH